MKIGYARVSTVDQSHDLQTDALIKAGCGEQHIYYEKESGKDVANRPKLKECLKAIRAGDTLVVYKLDRLGRSVRQVLNIFEELKLKGATIQAIADNLDPDTPQGIAMLQLTAVFSELEREMITQRVKAGLAAARARGRVGGRKSVLSAAQQDSIKTLVNSGQKSIVSIASEYKVSRGTIYNIIGRNPL